MPRRINQGDLAMLLRTPCPQCQTVKEYISEQVGQTRHCDHCGTEFVLKANNGRVMWQIGAATVVVLFIVFGLMLRASWGARKFVHGPVRSSAVSYEIDDDDR